MIKLPALQDRKTLLYLLAIGNTIAFATWQVMLNNFAVEQAAFTGEEIGILQSLREVPGFLAFTAPMARATAGARAWPAATSASSVAQVI